MVYRGKPSKDCQKCRERRIKCDLVKPACNQCIRADWECPGYRDELEGSFFHETEEVIRKVNKQKPSEPKTATTARTKRQPLSKALLSGPSEVSTSKSSEYEPLGKAPRPGLSPSVTQPIEHRATCFFLSSYVLGSHFDYLPSLYKESGMDIQLSASIHAASLASFSNEFNSGDVLRQSREQYGRALRLTNSALGSPKEATKDSTLIAVMLLGLYEILTCTNQSSSTSWMDHINGATVLLRLRGRQQLKTKLGLRMFKQVIVSIIASCIQHEVPIPAHIITLQGYAMESLGDNPAWRFLDTTMRFANLRASIKDGSLIDRDEIIDAAMKVDDDLVKWCETTPLQWRYETLFTDADPALVYEGYYHLYQDHHKAHVWNSVRMSRICLCQIIVGQILRYDSPPGSPILPDHTALIQLSANTVARMASEICASVPQFTEQPVSSSTQEAGLGSSDNVAGGYFLLWPLFIVGTLPDLPDSLHQWVIERLLFIGHSKKIPQAIHVAEMLGRKEGFENWLHMCHVF